MTKNQIRYRRNKMRVRDFAIEWQIDCATGERQLSYGELAEWTDMFRRLGKRYGLIREFKENAIL